MNTLNIIAGLSAIGTMKLFFKTFGIKEDLLVLEDSLKYGLLPRDFSNEEVAKRIQFLEKILGIYDDYPYTNIQNFVNFDFNKYDKIIVWHGNDTDEQLMLYLTCSVVKNDLYEVDITELRSEHSVLYCCTTDDVRILYTKRKPISHSQKQEYIQLWNKWSNSDSTLRIMDENNAIIAVNQDYFDELILSRCTSEYTECARIIGQLLQDCHFCVGDSFLLQRIIFLAREHKLSIRENEKFRAEIEKSNQLDKNKIVVDGVNASQMRFLLIRK